MLAARDSGTRRVWGLEERQRIVEEALAPGASVASVARRHGVNANLVFKWIRRSREGWLHRRRAPSKEPAVATMPLESVAPAFAPIKLLELSPAPAPASSSESVAKLGRAANQRARRGVMEISLPNSTRVSLDADVDAMALRRVLSALGAV